MRPETSALESSRPSVSVVVPTFQRRSSVVRALSALASQDLPARDFEVVVSVDGSDDGTAEALASFDAPYELRVVNGPRRGRAAACNAALSVTRGEVLVVLDDDMEPAPECLRQHRRHHTPNARVCVMGAAPIAIDHGASPAARYMAWKFGIHLDKLARSGQPFGLRDFYSGNASIRRELLLEVGLFDEGFTRYGNEDLELSLRLRSAGVTLQYDREALAHQHYEKDLTALTRDTFEKGGTAVLLARANPGAFRELQLASYSTAHSRAWRSLRAVLLRGTRADDGLASLVLRFAQLLERTPIARRPRFYILLLDYFYWLGVESALGTQTEEGQLAELAADVRHGPIRLLLHR